MKKLFLFLAILSIFHSSARADLTEKQRIDDATQVINLFHHNYAPFPWKEQLWDFNRNDIANELMEKAATSKNDLEFYDAIVRYLASFKDAHVSWQIPSTKIALLPFDVEDFAGEVIIMSVKDKNLGLEVGDQIISFGGKAVGEALAELYPYIQYGHIDAERKKAAYFLRNA